MLTILQPGLSEFSQVTQSWQVGQHPVVSAASTDSSACLPDVVNRVLGVVLDMMAEDGENKPDTPANDVSKLILCPVYLNCSPAPPPDEMDCGEFPIPEWAQQEAGRGHPDSRVLESWFLQCDQSGVSSHLMESMR